MTPRPPLREETFISHALRDRYSDDGHGNAPATRLAVLAQLRRIATDEASQAEAGPYLVQLLTDYRLRDVLPFEVLLAAGLLCRRHGSFNLPLLVVGNICHHLFTRLLQSDPMRAALKLDNIQQELPIPSDG